MSYYYLYVWCIFIFVFKQKTAYEMRISDWSSDVCSSDLVERAHEQGRGAKSRMKDEMNRSRMRPRRRDALGARYDRLGPIADQLVGQKRPVAVHRSRHMAKEQLVAGRIIAVRQTGGVSSAETPSGLQSLMRIPSHAV